MGNETDKYLEHAEHSKKVYESLYLYTKDSKITVDFNRLIDALLFFYDQQLQYIEAKDIPPIGIIIDPKDGKMIGCGRFFVNDEDSLGIIISTENILLSVSENGEQLLLFDSPLKTLFFHILHETHHLVSFLTDYISISRRRKITKKDFYEERMDKFAKLADKIFEKYKENYRFDNIHIATTNLKHEIEADRFAYSNLSYFENLYEQNGGFYISHFLTR